MATLKGRVLLGWMPRDAAVKFLLNDCVFNPTINATVADGMWQDYRGRVDALPMRPQGIPQHRGLTIQEVAHAKRFKQFLVSCGPHDILDVQKIDPTELIVIQYMVVTERSNGYANIVQTMDGWLKECLPTTGRNSQVQFTVQRPALQTTVTEIALPHSEFVFIPDPAGKFGATEWMRHVTVMAGADRMFLTAGYHRTFARVFTTPIATVPSAVVAVARNTLVSPTMPTVAPGVAIGAGVDPLCPFGAKAARFGDFFTDGLFMDIDLRKRRYLLQVNATVVAVDDPT